jgi:hypothetical protein
MNRIKPALALWAGSVMSAGAVALVMAAVSAGAQGNPPRTAGNPPPKAPNEAEVYLVRQDFSDCTNSNVPNVNGPLVAGNVWVTRESNGNTVLKVALTASPKTTYHFFLKCVRQLGDIQTDEDGVGIVGFSFPTSAVGNVYAFDSYPEGAPAGNKFQSAQVKFQ